MGIKGEILCGCFARVHMLNMVELPAAAKLGAMNGCKPNLSSLLNEGCIN